MSLESYRRDIEAQRERDIERGLISKPSTNAKVQVEQPQIIYIERQRRSGCSVPFIIVMAAFTVILIIAAIKNPSESQGKTLIKSYFVERLEDYLLQDLSDDTNSDVFINYLGKTIIDTFAPSMIDGAVKIKGVNYVFFTTFDVKVKGSERNLVSGIILFGKVIPLTVDIDRATLKKAGFKV